MDRDRRRPGRRRRRPAPARVVSRDGRGGGGRAGPRRSARPWAARPGSAALWLAIWLAPLGLLALALGAAHVFVQEGVFFSKTAAVTFGGAYAVLAYVAQQAVDRFGWLQPGEMLDGLGMAETTPGPLIQVVQFVGFMAAYRFPGGLDPMLAGVIGSVVVTWATFAPCFLWIFLGAPYIEWLRGQPRPCPARCPRSRPPSSGVILNLALWFSLHTLFGEVTEKHAAGMPPARPRTAHDRPGGGRDRRGRVRRALPLPHRHADHDGRRRGGRRRLVPARPLSAAGRGAAGASLWMLLLWTGLRTGPAGAEQGTEEST